MNLINNYKKCLRCGDKYRMESKRTHCLCGGFLYTVGTIYTEKAVSSSCAGATGKE